MSLVLFSNAAVLELGRQLGFPEVSQRKVKDVLEAGLASLAELSEIWESRLAEQSNGGQPASEAALADLCHTLFNSAAFLFVD